MAPSSPPGSLGSSSAAFTPPSSPGYLSDSSYYDLPGLRPDKDNPKAKALIYAREARSQQAGLPPGTVQRYPSYFGNLEKLNLSTPGSIFGSNRAPGYLHHPLMPGQTATWKPRPGVLPGGVRSVWTPGNPAVFDVIYHDERAGKSASGNDKFSMATYHPAAHLRPKRVSKICEMLENLRLDP
ncbi:hypothetical protein FDECE_3230 [Fusarium decemcellulare]|nr:hypothetical protein FDECE_3230 [Fusarium decemcellulare]